MALQEQTSAARGVASGAAVGSLPRRPLVLIPGLLCNEVLWRPQVAALASKADCWVADTASSDSMDDIVASILAAIPYERFSLAGLSMGGYIAARMAIAAPMRVERLALLNTRAHAQDSEAGRQRREATIAQARNGAFAEVVDGFIPSFLSETAAADGALVDTVRGMAMQVGAAAFVREQHANMHRADIASELGNIACPTWVIGSALDAIAPLVSQHQLADAITGAALFILPGCGHLSTLEQPTRINELMASWLDVDSEASATRQAQQQQQ